MLSSEDQAECLSHLPPLDVVCNEDVNGSKGRTLTYKPVEGFFEKNTALLDDIRTFQASLLNLVGLIVIQNDLGDGRFESSFLNRASVARERRLRGEFDKWKVGP